MPEVGEIKKVYVKESRKYIWVRCPDCNEERWVQERNFKRGGSTGLCLACYNKRVKEKTKGVRPPNWKGGVKRDKKGYTQIKLYPDDFFFSMAKADRYVLEHRLVMAKHLGRCLLPWEVVHHKNGIKDDNRIENLQLLPDKRWHLVDCLTQSYIKKLEGDIIKLRKSISGAVNAPL